MVGFLGGAAGGAAVSIVIRAIDNYSKEFKKLDKKVDGQKGAFRKLGNMLETTGIGYAAVAGAAVGFAAISVNAAIKSEQAMQQFNLALGDVADTMLQDMRVASKGMISDFNLVKDANAALALGISKNQIPALLEVATARAKVFGRTASDAFNDLAIGIGRQSRMILDNLGIIIDLDKAYGDYAEKIGTTVDELTEFEKKAALTNEILTNSKGLVQANIFLQETHAEKIERLTASYENAKEAIGDYLLLVFDNISGITQSNEALIKHVDNLVGITGAYDEAASATLNLGNAERELTAELKASNQEAQSLIDSLLDLKDVTFKGERQSELNIANQKEVVRQLELREAKGQDVGDQLDNEKDKLRILRLENEEFANERAIQQAENAIDLEKIGELESTNFRNFANKEEQRIQQLEKERNKQDEINDKIKEVQDTNNDLLSAFNEVQTKKEKGYDTEKESIEELINSTKRLTLAYKEAISEGDSVLEFKDPRGRTRLEMLKDLGREILKPFRKKESLDKDIQSKDNITISIENVNGLDSEMVSEAMAHEIKKVIRL